MTPKLSKLCKTACISLLAGAAIQAEAQFLLVDGNSTAFVDATTPGVGMNSWTVQGQQQLNQQWFWYRVGNAAETPINAGGVATFVQPTARDLTTTYAYGAFSIRVDYKLTGGSFVGFGQNAVSDISEAITIQNNTGAQLDFHFFQYSDFGVNGQPGDSVQLGKNLFTGKYNVADQFEPLSGLTETVLTPGADHGEAAFAGATLAKLNDGVASGLNDVTSAGPGNVTWAFQWDLLIPAGESVIISKDKALSVQIIPEPTTLSLAGLGLLGLIAARKRR